MSANAFDTYKFGGLYNACVSCIVVCAIRLVNEAPRSLANAIQRHFVLCARAVYGFGQNMNICSLPLIALRTDGRAKALYSAVYFWPCELFRCECATFYTVAKVVIVAIASSAIDCCCIVLGVLLSFADGVRLRFDIGS